ncbi:hypothetical protein QF028_004814 [Neobacillus sp. B4I6]
MFKLHFFLFYFYTVFKTSIAYHPKHKLYLNPLPTPRIFLFHNDVPRTTLIYITNNRRTELSLFPCYLLFYVQLFTVNQSICSIPSYLLHRISKIINQNLDFIIFMNYSRPFYCTYDPPPLITCTYKTEG